MHHWDEVESGIHMPSEGGIFKKYLEHIVHVWRGGEWGVGMRAAGGGRRAAESAGGDDSDGSPSPTRDANCETPNCTTSTPIIIDFQHLDMFDSGAQAPQPRRPRRPQRADGPLPDIPSALVRQAQLSREMTFVRNKVVLLERL